MRKSLLFVAVFLFMAVPVMAASTVTITCDPDGNEVTVTYAVSGSASLIRAFGLDIKTDSNDANIVKVDTLDPNYRIYPGQIDIVEGKVEDYGMPYAAIGGNSITIEMGSLYTEDANYAGGDPNFGYGKKPQQSGTLLKFYVDDNCHYTIDVNAARGGIVMEDPCEGVNDNLPCEGDIMVGCVVPNVEGMTEAAANVAIDACNLVPGPNVPECNNTMANGLVLRTNPVKDSVVNCGSPVTKYVSLNPPQPGAASVPDPCANGFCVPLTKILSWTPGANTDTQDVYFGIQNPPPYRTTVSGATTTYDPVPDMNYYTLYYWRINEKSVGNCKVTVGPVWCFVAGPGTAGKPCCSSDPLTRCLGNINFATNTRVDNADIGLLTTFVSGKPSNRCSPTVVGDPATGCPPCFDMNGSGRVDNADIGILTTRVSGFASNRHTCPYPSCSNPP